MGDTESCGSRASEVQANSLSDRKGRQKVEVYHEVLRRLRDLGNEEARRPGFEDDLWAHFNRLTLRYALDVKVERTEDVLMHKKLLDMAHDPTTRPAIEVRLVQANPESDVNYIDSVRSNIRGKVDAQNSGRYLHEITISSLDKRKFLTQFTSLISEIGLNIQEAHAFSTEDGYSLDVFVVDGWKDKKPERLRSLLLKEILKIEKVSWSQHQFISLAGHSGQREGELTNNHVSIPTNGVDVWEIDAELLKFESKISTGSHFDLYKGTFRTQDVAIKIVKAAFLNEDVKREFSQEVYILRKVRHENIVQFIGACARPPNLCIVTEFMPGGSVYDFMHKQKGVFRFSELLRVAIGVSNGMDYLHQNDIIHRDLKTANLLMGENEVVKVADFGVARVQTQSGVMTAETGTYRWMAPEVIEHKPYDHKADIFSFGIVLWELLTTKLPYERLTPLQAAVGVVKKGLRPTIPKHTHPEMVELLVRCWQQDPSLRPDFSEITQILQNMADILQNGVTEEERASKRRNHVGETHELANSWPVKREENLDAV